MFSILLFSLIIFIVLAYTANFIDAHKLETFFSNIALTLTGSIIIYGIYTFYDLIFSF